MTRASRRRPHPSSPCSPSSIYTDWRTTSCRHPTSPSRLQSITHTRYAGGESDGTSRRDGRKECDAREKREKSGRGRKLHNDPRVNAYIARGSPHASFSTASAFGARRRESGNTSRSASSPPPARDGGRWVGRSLESSISVPVKG
jgi:hypothetical protein